MTVKGYDLLGEGLRRKQVETMFFLMGGPTIEAAAACVANGIRMIDVRHEQAAAMMAHAYSRSLGKPGICMAASGPGTMNLTTGLGNALIDCAPVIAIGGSSPIRNYQRGDFQEIDQVAMMRPVTKWAERIYEARRIPEYIDMAFRKAMSGKPGPVFLDIPGDVLFADVEEKDVVKFRDWSPEQRSRPAASAAEIARLVEALNGAKRPVVLSGSGVLWSGAADALRQFIETTTIPFFTTPQGRGVVPEDSPLFMASARSAAMREADFVLVVGTRLNYVFGFGRPPTFAADARFARIDIDPAEIEGTSRTEIGITGDARTVLDQLLAALSYDPAGIADWRRHLAAIEEEKRPGAEAELANDQIPIHPLRLCKEVRDFMDRDAVLAVDGQEILNYARRSIPTFVAGHRLNSGPFGIMGVGLPFGIGAKVAKPDKQVIVLHGDGSFGFNGMELDTAIRHKLPVLVVISLNGGWTADPDRKKVGRDLGYTRYDEMAKALGCHGEYVERPEDIRPALERAKAAVAVGQTAVVNVVTDWRARAQTRKFTQYAT